MKASQSQTPEFNLWEVRQVPRFGRPGLQIEQWLLTHFCPNRYNKEQFYGYWNKNRLRGVACSGCSSKLTIEELEMYISTEEMAGYYRKLRA